MWSVHHTMSLTTLLQGADMKIIGSTALNYFWSDWRLPVDLDMIIREGEFNPNRVDPITLPVSLYEMFRSEQGYVVPDDIYTLKCSHLGFNSQEDCIPKWYKHKRDIIEMSRRGCKLNLPLYDTLKDYWSKTITDKSFLSLDKKKSDFFNDHVTYKYDHDYLHDLVSYPNKPVYTKCLVDGEQVRIDKNKFDILSHSDKIRMFKEEITVIAVERWLIPSGGNISWIDAYNRSLRKTITTLTKGWATDFIVENLEEFDKSDFSYFKNIMEVLDMSNKVDMSVFEELLANTGCDMDGLVVALADNSLFDEYKFDITYPDRNGRDYKDPEYRAEYEACYQHHQRLKNEVVVALGYEHLQQEGGGEGGAESCFGVFKLKGKVYQAFWRYYSSDGYETYGAAESLREVKPVQKTITVYE